MAARYSSYKGKKLSTQIIKWTLITLGVLALAFVIFFFVLQRFITYTSDGVRVDLPWVSQVSQPPPPLDSPPPIVTGAPESSPAVTPTPAPTPTPTPAKLDNKLSAITLPSSALTDPAQLETYIALVSSTDINALMIEMKAPDGKLYWDSAFQMPKTAKAASPDIDIAAVVKKLRDGGVPHLIARVSVFRDNKIPRFFTSTSIKTKSGYMWLDNNNRPWLNPYSEESAEYMTAIISELSQFGFDEIALDNLQFPTAGKVSMVYYGESPPGKDTAIASFLTKLKSAVGSNAQLSCFVDYRSVSDADFTAAGQNLNLLLPLVSRVYIDCSKATAANFGDAYASISQKFPDLLPNAFVPVIPSPEKTSAAAGRTLNGDLDKFARDRSLGWIVDGEKYPLDIFTR